MMQELSGYRLGEALHREAGGNAIYRATRVSDGAPVILKMLDAEFPSPEDVARLEHELALGRELSLPSVRGYLDLVRSGRSLVAVLEDFGGASLDERLRTGPLSVAEFLRVAPALARGLADLHRAGVVHNDICPANVLVTPDLSVTKLADLGAATRLLRTEPQAYRPELLEGTLAYISPERTGRMNRAVDHRADLYSLGATFYAALTGAPPFQASDAMGLIHAHIARPPVPVVSLRPEVPRVLSELVGTLLAKTPEDRYQSAEGLLADLERIAALVAAGPEVPFFALRSEDRQLHFTVSEKLYGRETEVRELLESFERASVGALELVVLRGLPGIGKSVLVHEVHKPIVARRGTYAGGKFDQLAQATPLSGVTQALRGLFAQLLAESAEVLAQWQQVVLQTAGADAAAIAEVLPEALPLLGHLPAVLDLGPTQNRERFDRVLWAVVQAFASAEHPLVLFFDDLQWIDAASLRFLTGLASSPESRHILLLFALRSNEVDANHPVSLALEKIAHVGTPIREIALGPLGPDELVAMVSDSVARSPEDVRELAVSLHQKTGGNPFFVTQFLKGLVEDGLVRYEREARQWGWDMGAILRLDVLSDVAPFLSAKVGRYGAEVRGALAQASVLGATFDLETLSILTGLTPRETAKALWAPLQDGLLLPLDAGFHYAGLTDALDTGAAFGGIRYKFAHDRIQEACHSFIPADKAEETSLRIARTLEERLPKEQRGDRLFDIAGHFRAAGALVTEPEERRRVAALHLEAAQRAKAATAYATALSHALAGIALLDEGAWKSDYAVMYPLHRERIDCEFLAGNVERAEVAYDAVAPFAEGAIDKAEIAQLLIRICLTADRPADGLRIGRESLAEMDIELPADGVAAGAAMAEERTKIAALIGAKPIPQLIHHRHMDDPAMETRLGLLHETWTCAIMTGDFQEITHTALKIVRLSLEHGHCKFSACGYVAHAAVLTATGDYAAAKDYGELSVDVCRQFADVFIIPKVHNTFANFTNHWVNHLRTNVKLYEESYAACRQSGDRWWGAWAVGWIRTAQLVAGVRLDEVLATAEKYHPYIEASGYTPLVWMSVLDRQILRCLLGRTDSPTSFTSDGVTEESIEKAFADMGFGFGLFLYNNYKSLAAWLVGDAALAAELSRKAESTKEHIPGLMPYPDFFLYNTLAFAARAPDALPEERAELLAGIDRNIERMTVWAGVCPENFQHRLLLMRAERARVGGFDAEAASLYEQAIESAARDGYLQNEAIANECAAKHHLAMGRERASRGYFTEAAYLYERWGAFRKVASLHEGERGARPTPLLPSRLGRTARIGQDSLDLSTVMEAAGALSRELRQDRLLSQLLTLSMRHAGAERAFFLQQEEGRTRVAAALSVGGDLVAAAGQPIEQRDDLALSVVRYVERTAETLAVDDAFADPRFARDASVSRRKAKSILCLPVMRQGVIAGVLYLENGLTAAAFNESHVRLLELLAAQAAISIENAALYDTLEQKVAARTRELAEKNEELVQKNAEILRAQGQLVQSEKMASLGQLVAGVAHEINNPINFIASGLPSLRRDVDKVAEMVPAGARDATFDKVRGRLAKLLTAIQEGAQRTAEIVKNLRSFSRLDEAAQKAVDLHEGLDSTLVLLGSKVRDGIQVEKQYGALPLVECFPSQLNQVFMNLLVNAIQAMDERGTLTISTERSGPNSVRVAIRDTGKGIPVDVLAKIFDPFFTTKSVGEGTGLGLSISHEIIAKHRGQLSVESEVGVGTTFRIELPIAGGPGEER
jgi:histidine kinase